MSSRIRPRYFAPLTAGTRRLIAVQIVLELSLMLAMAFILFTMLW